VLKILVSQRPNRARPLEIDTEVYKWRRLIENFFCKPKEFKRTAMRATKPISLNPAAVLIWDKDLGPPCNCGLRFRRAQAELAGSADDHAGTDAALR
jgi:hypothetical protein